MASSGGRKCIIISRKAPSKCLHLDEGRTSNGTRIHLWDIRDTQTSHPNQEWLWDGNLIKSAKSPGKCLHLDGRTGIGNGCKVHLWDLKSGDYSRQQWYLRGNDIVSKTNSKYCMHLHEGGTGNGTKIHMWDARNAQNGSWRIQWIGAASASGKAVTLSPHLEIMYGYDNGGSEPVKQKVIDVEGFTSAKGSSSTTTNTKSLSMEVSASYGFPMGMDVSASVSASASSESSWGSTNSTSLSTTRTIATEFVFPPNTLTEVFRWTLKVKGGHLISLPGSVVVLKNGKSRTGKTKKQLEASAAKAVLRPLT